jgi:hypothetical protein
MKKQNTIIILLLIVITALSSCRKDQIILYGDNEIVDQPDKSIQSFYLLNEGNMGMNRASIDYYNSETATYNQDIFALKNPSVVKELGDVGNDIGIYGSKLYAVINCSNYIEVMDAKSVKHITEIKVPNCRFIKFYQGKAYISSYAGKVGMDPNAEVGFVAEIDTTTLQVTRKVNVGHQPEEMVILNNKLYVANSGGYRAPNYDRTVSVVDLNSFTVMKDIDVDINLSSMAIDKHQNIFVVSRGNNSDIPPSLHVINSNTDQVIKKLDIPVTKMCLLGDSLYYISAPFSFQSETKVSYGILNTETFEIINDELITDDTAKSIVIPYGIAVDPKTKQFIITDAQNYIASGYVYCFSAEGKMKWKKMTGNIPAHIVFTDYRVDNTVNPNPPDDNDDYSAYITSILDYRPAPGQFVNTLPIYEEGDTQEKMNQKVLQSIGNNQQNMITLGSYGGYVICGFDHAIENKTDAYDFEVIGNTFKNSSEPGIIKVAYDKNKNNQPDADEWFEIAGSEYTQSETIHQYEITYYRTPEDHTPTPNAADPYLVDDTYIRWSDNQNQEGYVYKNMFHAQDYYPKWITTATLTYTGTKLKNNARIEKGIYILPGFEWGYADNAPNGSEANKIKIDWAVNEQGEKVNLPEIHWIKISTGQNQYCGVIGNTSTEVLGITDLHQLEKKKEKK